MSAIGDSNVHVQVDGTTFSGIYEVVGSTLELTSADFGERSAIVGDEDPHTAAENLLRSVAEIALRDSPIPFLRDDGTVTDVEPGVGGEETVLHQRPSRSQQQTGLLADFAQMAAESSSTESLLHLACTQMSRGMGTTHADVMRYRPETGDLLVVAGVGWNAGVVGHATTGADPASSSGLALRTKQPVAVEDLSSSTEFRHSAVMQEHGLVAVLASPIAIDGTIWGVAEVASRAQRSFGAADIHYLSVLASLLALNLERRSLLERIVEGQASHARALSRERMLFEELHHRSKNDLQLILGMLVMQKGQQRDDQVKRGFDDIMDRVAAIGLAHDQLNVGRGSGRVELATYLGALCANLGQRRADIEVRPDLARMEISHERAVALGLVLNELVTNALKHAFPGDRTGTVQVVLAIADEDNGRLRVDDDGAGMGQRRAGSAGTELVLRLVQQIGGRVDVETGQQGTGFEISFPLLP